jgi:arylsulfatase A-like enzyme
MSFAGRAARTALAQWPPLVVAWSIHGILLFFLFFRYVPAQAPLGGRLAVVGGVLCLLLVEAGLLLAASFLLEVALAWLPAKWAVDALKALFTALALGLLGMSILKFHETSVHLRPADLWFAWVGFRQIVAEATPRDLLAVLSLPIGVLLVGVGLTASLHRFRRRLAGRTSRRLAAASAGAAIVLLALDLASPPLRLFSEAFVPEVHWLRAAWDAGRRFPSPPADENGALAAHLGPPIEPYPRRAAAHPYNVVLVMLESVPWKRTVLGDGAPLGSTPVLERLASESIVFTHAYATSTHSDYAQMSILSSLHPRKYDRHDYYVRIDYPRTLLWDVLERAGYTSSLFSCQNERWGNMLNFLDTPGLAVLRHSPDWPRALHRGDSVESKVFEETPVAEWERWRAAHPAEPFFSYFNFQADHFPYELPPGEPRPFAPFALDFPASFLDYPRDKVPVMLNRFHNALAYSDRAIGRVIDFLERRGEWQRTVLIVVSDHGEAFYEHGMPTHGTALFEEQVRSLWILRVPGETARTIDQPVSLLDVAPTLLTVLGLPPHGNFQGRSDVLSSDYDGSTRPLPFTIQGLTMEDGLRLGGWKYMVNWDRRSRSLYDLANDPDESVDLFDQRPDKAREMDGVLAGLVLRQLAYYRERGWRQGHYPPALP